MVVVKQPEPVRPYTGTTLHKAYKEYFERICVCNEWKSQTECARHLLVAMDGAASEAVRGLKAEKDSDLALICEALSRSFGFVDEPERAMRRCDVRKQLEGETLAVFQQSLRMLHREAWPKTDIKSPETDSLLRRKFIDGILDLELQRYLRLHATSDDFATTMSKARQFVDANDLSRTTKKSALRTTSPSVNYQAIIDGVMEALELRDRERMAEVNAAQTVSSSAAAGNRNKKAPPRQGSPAPSNSSAGSSSSRASSAGRTVRFQDQVDGGQSNQGYGSPGRSRWQANQSSLGNNDGSRPWVDRRPSGQGSPRLQPHRRDGRHDRVVRVIRRHSREVNGCQGKGAHVLVPLSRAMQATGGPVDGHAQATEVANRRFSNSIRRGNSVGTRVTSSHQQLLTCRHLVDAMSVITWDATACSMGPTPCPHRHHRLWNVSSAVNEDVVRLATQQVLSRQCRMCQTSRQDQFRDQSGMQPIRSQTGSGARTRARGPRRPMYLQALSQIRRSLSPLRRRLT